ncbi:amino acid aminotransferase [Meridianimarinicoccus sp. RP-17]|uniref:amino acid aminotransferase n=1 Tax=Meridianimarinicoccus zhengii TaxID=2056810 RepID=UPI000DAE1685|nr:aromatic amino acid transaminase [Phycocomes zhengii]
MFDRLTPDAPDAILALMQAFRDDPRADKIDLGVGVFRDATGQTPVMAAVRAAEARLAATQSTKTYTSFTGTPEFGQAMARLVLDGAVAGDRLAVAATTGGTGALRMAFDLVRGLAPHATVWLPEQGWPNHAAILRHLGMPMRSYAHAAPDGTLAFDRMMADLGQAAAGDVVVLHGCCHNPTGIDPDLAQWAAIAALCAARGLLPLVDLAYLGFGDGIAADAAGLRHLARTCPETLVAVSASKSFGVYRDRVGALIAIASGPAPARALRDRLATLNRMVCSFPPDHGARVVQTVLDDPALHADWAAELDAMRRRIADLRHALAAALAAATAPDPGITAIARQRGMFSRLPLSPDRMDRLRSDHAVYATRDGRINIAGLTDATVPLLAARIGAVTRA